MFKFNFDVDGDDGPRTDAPTPPTAAADDERVSELSLSHVLASLPPLISYSPLPVPLSARTLTLPRRDLFDARFQLISHHAADNDNDALAFLDAPSDLVPGVYEGGLKTWECSLDLAQYLDASHHSRSLRGTRILEIGCGTAVPSLYILHTLFSSAPDPSRETHIHLQDYNPSVLQLVTLPNILLTWYFSPAAAPLRPAAHSPVSPAELPITPELLAAFRAALAAHAVSLRLFAGAWAAFAPAHPYDLVLTAETLYRPASLPALVRLLRAAAAPGGQCLVAAKLVYFGVGGGVAEFVRAVEGARGAVETVWEERAAGVARAVMRVEWSGQARPHPPVLF